MPLRGETIGTAFVRLMVDGDKLPESVRRELRKATPEMEHVGEEHSRAYNEGFSAQQKKDKNVEKSLTANIQRAFAKMDADADFFSKGFGTRLATNIDREIKRSFPQFSKSSERLSKVISDGILKDFARTGNFNLNLRKRLLDAVDSAGSDNRWDKLSRRIDLVGDHFGKAFGKGSRNNFLNFIGTVMGGLVDLGQALPQAVKGAQDIFTAFREGFTEAGGGLKGILSGISGAGGTLGPLLKNLPALAVGIGIAVSALGVLAAGLSGVAAAATALAASLTFAVVGAIAPLIGLILPLAASVGVLILAFGGLGKAARKTLGQELKPVTKELLDLRHVAQQGLFGNIKQDAKDLAPALGTLRPLVKSVAGSLRGVFVGFAKAANTPGFKAFVDDLSRFLPSAIAALGRISVSVLGGLGGVFVALEPITKRFLRFVERLAERFDHWANSAKGKNQLKDFFAKAGDSARDVWNLLVDISHVIGTLFGSGKPTGDNIITDLDKQARNFNDFLKKNPNGLKDWFANGKQTIENVGTIVRSILGVIQILDTPENRRNLQTLLQTIAVGFDAVRLALAPANLAMTLFQTGIYLTIAAGKAMVGPLKTAFYAVELAFLDIVGGIVHAAALAFGWVPGLGGKLKAADRKIQDFAESAKLAIDGIPKHFTITAELQTQINGINASSLNAQAKKNALNYAWDHARAMGGPVWPGVGGYLVGENGPEWFQPSGRGMIVPNHDPAVQQILGNSSSTTNTTTNVRHGKSIDASGWTIVTPTEDPRRVADEVVNRLAGATL